MSDRKIVVPEGMLKAVGDQYEKQLREVDGTRGFTPLIEAALIWLSYNFVRPTDRQFGDMVNERRDASPDHWMSMNEWNRAIILICEWQRRMFLAPDPPVDPLVMYIKRHFESDHPDPQLLDNRAKAVAHDYQEHVKRNGGGQ